MDLTALAPRVDLLAAAVVLDAVLGDPVYRLHPIRLMGRSLAGFESALRAAGLGGRCGGCLLLVLLSLLWVGGTAAAVAAATAFHAASGWAVHLFLLYSLLALRDLLRHGAAVDRAVAGDGLGPARDAVRRLVGRDVESMDGAACRRAAIESLGENLVDGFVSPVFWYVLAGLPGIVLFKCVSTMDSMVGYMTPRYLRFGWCGARTDDLMNFLPARVTWPLVALSALFVRGCSPAKALRVGWRQHGIVPGPNPGWGEAAVAGAIQRRLIGPIYLGGRLVTDVWLGDQGDPPAGSGLDYRRAALVVSSVAAFATAGGIGAIAATW